MSAKHLCIVCQEKAVPAPNMMCPDCAWGIDYEGFKAISTFFECVTSTLRSESKEQEDSSWLDEFWKRIEGGTGPIRW